MPPPVPSSPSPAGSVTAATTTPSDFNLEMLPSIFESHSLSDSLVLRNYLSFHVLKSDFLNSGRHLWRILCARVSAGAVMLDGVDPPCEPTPGESLVECKRRFSTCQRQSQKESFLDKG